MGAAMVQSNQDAKAIEQLQHAGKVVSAIGSRLSPLHVGALAQAYGKTGRVEEGLSLATRVLAGVREVSNLADESWLFQGRNRFATMCDKQRHRTDAVLYPPRYNRFSLKAGSI
jgi:hypothetical protein